MDGPFFARDFAMVPIELTRRGNLNTALIGAGQIDRQQVDSINVF
jgi:hypothetical protein